MSRTPKDLTDTFLQLLPPPPPPTSTPSDDPTFIEKEELYNDVIDTVVIRYSEEILTQLNIQKNHCNAYTKTN